VQPPRLLVDEMIEGPFAVFVHEHRFEPEGENACVMHDTVTYQWGRSWWGNVVSAVGVRLYLTMLFLYRHHRTRKWVLAEGSGKR
jgi:ligand-binding SRPBCC domain-containing protein